ncbi:MAG: Gfo/Idh/MocA family oxidoreductase [Clostridia bacterium]|nr:Gfo/Idh/MocA family oxidoreductase [Clostridia bacterium]
MSDAVLSQFTQQVEEEKKESGRKLKVGIIGTGWIAESHVESYLDMDDVEIVAMADLIPGKAEKFAARYGVENVRFYPSHKELIDNEQLDAVSVCTYNMTHAECTIYALEHGVNVLLEKPMCVTTEEAVEIMRAEKKSGKILSIGFQPRLDENMKMVKQIVQSGVLGDIYYIQTGGGRRRGIPNSTFIEQKTAGIGAMGDIGCYSLDMVLNAIGYPKPLTVTGYTSGFFGANPKYNNPADAARFNVEDFAAAFVRLEGGIILDFRISWAMHIDSPGDTVILGTEGALRIPATECWNGSIGGPMTIYSDMAGNQVETTIPVCENRGKGLFYKKVRSFLDAILEGGEAPVPTSQILYNQAIIDHIVKSAKLGKEIDVVIPEI